MIEQLFELIKTTVALSERDQALCRQYFEPVYHERKTLLEQPGRVPKYLYYIVSGYMRLFHCDEQGNEVTTHLNCQHNFFSDYQHFSSQTISVAAIECITDCELLRITRQDLELLTGQSSVLKDFSIWVLQQSVIYNEERARDLARLSAEERYFKLLREQPGILQHVPLQYIASFLGMNAKSLSRIRKNIIR